MIGSAAPKTPATAVISLQQELARAEQMIAEKNAEIARLQRLDKVWHSFQITSFGGIPMAQYWCDMMLWESALNSNPELKQIIEIGTWQGGFSLWLHAQAEARSMSFVTYDAVPPNKDIPRFVRMDVFANATKVGKSFMEPMLLFCDGGNKPRELKTFFPYLKDPRSLIAVHDWGTETQPEDVPEELEMLYTQQFEEMDSITRFFRVKSVTA